MSNSPVSTVNKKPLSIREELTKAFEPDPNNRSEEFWQRQLITHFPSKTIRLGETFEKVFLNELEQLVEEFCKEVPAPTLAEMTEILNQLEAALKKHRHKEATYEEYRAAIDAAHESDSSDTDEDEEKDRLATEKPALPTTLSDHKGFMTVLVRKKASNLQYASERLKNDPDLAKILIKDCDWGTLNWHYIGEELKADPTFIHEALQLDPFIYPMLAKELQTEERFDLVYAKSRLLFQHAPDPKKYSLPFLVDYFTHPLKWNYSFDDKQIEMLKEHYKRQPYAYTFYPTLALKFSMNFCASIMGGSLTLLFLGPLTTTLIAFSAITFLISTAALALTLLTVNRQFHLTFPFHWHLSQNLYKNDKFEATLLDHFSKKEEFCGDKILDVVHAIKNTKKDDRADAVKNKESSLYKALNQKRFLPFTLFGPQSFYSHKSRSLQKAEIALEASTLKPT